MLGILIWAGPHQNPQFRTGTDLVRVEVRVLDKDGEPIRDLSAKDFVVSEDGVPQEISTFERISGDTTDERWIVVVLGQGRLQHPSKCIDALQAVLQTDVLPTDQIGVIAYNRWADFAADRHYVISLLDRYKAANDEIQTALETSRSGLRGQGLAALEIPEHVQSRIDSVFQTSPNQSVREFAPSPNMGRMSVGFEVRTRFTQGRFDDLLHLYGAIEYLRPKHGDRDIIFLVEQSSFGSSQPSRLGMDASDAHTALHIVQCGGFGKPTTVVPMLPSSRFGGVVSPPSSTSAELGTDRRASDLAAYTGGLSFFYSDPRKALRTVSRAIHTEYLIGYVPKENSNKAYRRISVDVARRDVQVLFRHGYHVYAERKDAGDESSVVERVMASASAINEARGLTVQAAVSASLMRNAAQTVDAVLKIEPSQVSFQTVGSRHLAALEVRIWIRDQVDNSVGTAADRIDLNLSENEFARLTKTTIDWSRKFDVTGSPAVMRAAVYDVDGDRLGVVTTKIHR